MLQIGVESRAVETERLRVEGPRWSVLLAGLRRPKRFLGELIARVDDDRTLTWAAAMAYYFFLATFPLLLFVVALVSVLPVQGIEDWLLGALGRVVPPEASGMVEKTIRSVLSQPRGGLLSFGAGLALWVASTGFTSVMGALNIAYRVPEGRPWWRVRLVAIGLTAGLSVLMIVAFVLAVFGGALADLVAPRLGPAAAPVLLVARWVIVLVAVTVVVAAVYYACPDVEQELHWVTPGSLTFTLGFGAASAAFSYYVRHFGSYDATYGSLGAVIILLVWMYLLAFFLVFGGQVNALLEHMSRAGKEPGQKEKPPADVQGARVARGERTQHAS